MTYLDRYLAGEHEAVWAELVGLGADVRNPGVVDDARAVAQETMRRARSNVQTLRERLLAAGYAFAWPEAAHIAPPAGTADVLDRIEATIGPLPLSLRAFYEVVGSVNFTQSPKQLIQWSSPRRDTAGDLELVGEEDPLVVFPLASLERECFGRARARRVYFCFAPDEFHKAGYSGGENYHVWLPDESADVTIEGMYEIEEMFVQHLRECFRGGGFRGKIPLSEDDSPPTKPPPDNTLARALADGLMPI